MRKILFTVNTLGRAGAETALLKLLKRLEGRGYEIYLYVMMNQGELIDKIPPYVHVLNTSFNPDSVLSRQGQWGMMKTVLRSFFRNGNLKGKIDSFLTAYRSMKKMGNVQRDKLLWRIIAEGAPRFDQEFDLAVAWIEGASAYYTAEYVKATEKAAFIHIDYMSAGYTREMDRDSFDRFSRIFTVSEETREHFVSIYPEHKDKTGVFHNIVDAEEIRNRAKEDTGFPDDFQGKRLLTVGRLTHQKGYDVAVDAMKILRDTGENFRWYVLGEGPERQGLERKIARLGLKDHFLLMGAVDNPYPYYRQADLYVHATRFEGKSIAIQEAQILGCPVIATDCRGNREQIEEGVNGILCGFTPEAIAQSILDLARDDKKRAELREGAEKVNHEYKDELNQLIGNLT